MEQSTIEPAEGLDSILRADFNARELARQLVELRT
jgi:hypothetical protein